MNRIFLRERKLYWKGRAGEHINLLRPKSVVPGERVKRYGEHCFVFQGQKDTTMYRTYFKSKIGNNIIIGERVKRRRNRFFFQGQTQNLDFVVQEKDL